MNTKALYRGRIIFSVCFALCGQQAFAANQTGSSMEFILLVVVSILFLLLIVGLLLIRKMFAGFTGQSQKILQENESFIQRQTEAEKKSKELETQKNELEAKIQTFKEKETALEAEKNELVSTNEELISKLNARETEISTLNSNKKDLEQLLVSKIKESDALQREVSDKLLEAEQRLKDAESIHDNFFIETIHEMRTPLSLVLGSLALVVQKKDENEDMSTQLLSAYRNTLALQDLADQLIGTRRANDVANYLRIARYDMVEISRQICDLFVDWVAMNNVDFQINTQTSVLWIWLDRRKMEYALRTLLSNAFKNTFSYGKVSLDLSVVQKDGKAFCSLSVCDEGLDENESARRGLKQVGDMIDDIGGVMSNETTTSGTVYTLLIPLGKQHLLERRVEFVEPEADLVKLNDRQKEEISEFIQIIPKKKTTGKKILVIDDSDQIRWFLKHVFAKEYEIFEARNGEEGVKVAREVLPDLVLCDVMMPVKDGFETCKELKSDSRTSQIPVVMLTAKVESEDVITGIEAGADDYITKPFSAAYLKARIFNLLEQRKKLQALYCATLLPSAAEQPAESGQEEKTSLPNLSPNDRKFMDKVMEVIEKHLDNGDLLVEDIANEVNMSRSVFFKKLKTLTGLSPVEFLREIRMKRAAQLIETEEYSMSQIAYMVGLNDSHYFSKCFKQQYGITPTEYKESRKQNKR